MMDFEQVRAIKRAAQGRLLAIPGVHSVGIGSKIVAGQRTPELAIMVFVVKKRPVSELPADQVIPPEINGVKTDVYESEIPRSQTIDDDKERPLIGGVQLEPGGFSPNLVSGNTVVQAGSGIGSFGTLGCLAITGDAHPKLMAITCHHVVAETMRGETTNLTATPVVPNINFGGSNTPNSLVVINLTAGGQDFDVFYRTSSSDTLTTIATAVAARILALGVAGLGATATGTSVKLNFAGHLSYNCAVYSQAVASETDVRASVSGTTISVTGQASQACAAYVTINVGGGQPTFGVFVPIASGANASTVATSIATKITARGLSGVTAIEMDPPTPGDPATVSVTGVQEIECDVSSDRRVGQPTNSFCSKCCKCCDDRIGVVFDARKDIDVALIQVDPEYIDKYRAEIKEIGVVKGTHDITHDPSGYPLQKRGRTTGQTFGTLLAVDQDGDSADVDTHNTPPTWRLFRRHYTGAFTIQGAGFSDVGDSGSAIVTHTANAADPDNNKIAGILFAGTGNESWATPILPILSAFGNLNLSIVTATSPGVDQNVPAVAVQPASLEDHSPNAATEDPPGSTLLQLSRVEREITATPAGKRYSELVQRHFSEAQTLVNKNRRVATAWHRNGGPKIVRGVLRMAQSPDESFSLPAEIDGKPLPECLAGIQSVFTRYGSPALAADMSQYGPALAQLAGLTYSQTLDALRNIEIE
jgi:hypothetical protein